VSLPDFFIIGAPKAGTTALHTALARHPQLFMSGVKEPKFFLCDGPPPKRGGPGDAQTYQEYIWRRSDYEALFANSPERTLRGESTPFYLWDRLAQERIRREVPHAKLIAVLRDPIDRAHSNWTHLWSAGLDPIDDFVAACRAQDQRIAAGWAPFWRYLELGRYGEQIADLFTRFPSDQVLVLRYAQVRDHPDETLDTISRFLGISQGVVDHIPPANVTTHVPGSLLNRSMTGLLRAGAAVGHLFPARLRATASTPLLRLLHRGKGARPPVTAEQRAELLPYFTDDVALLERETGQDFQDWLRTGAGKAAFQPRVPPSRASA
jgi:sulfotransferase family protein